MVDEKCQKGEKKEHVYSQLSCFHDKGCNGASSHGNRGVAAAASFTLRLDNVSDSPKTLSMKKKSVVNR